MASPMFEVYDRNLRRIYWLSFIDDQLNSNKRNNWRASLLVNAQTGRPIAENEPEPPEALRRLSLRTAAAG